MCVCVCVYIYINAIKKNEIFPFVTTWMALEGVILYAISQAEKCKTV